MASAACFSLGACLNKSRYTSEEERNDKSACLETGERGIERGAEKKRRQDVTGTLIERFAHTCSVESREFLPLSNNVPGLRIPGAMGTIMRFVTKFPCNIVRDGINSILLLIELIKVRSDYLYDLSLIYGR